MQGIEANRQMQSFVRGYIWRMWTRTWCTVFCYNISACTTNTSAGIQKPQVTTEVEHPPALGLKDCDDDVFPDLSGKSSLWSAWKSGGNIATSITNRGVNNMRRMRTLHSKKMASRYRDCISDDDQPGTEISSISHADEGALVMVDLPQSRIIHRELCLVEEPQAITSRYEIRDGGQTDEQVIAIPATGIKAKRDFDMFAGPKEKEDRCQGIGMQQSPEVFDRPATAATAERDRVVNGVSSPPDGYKSTMLPDDLPRRRTFDLELFMGKIPCPAEGTSENPDCRQQPGREETDIPARGVRGTYWDISGLFRPKVEDLPRQAAGFEPREDKDSEESCSMSAVKTTVQGTGSAMRGHRNGEPIPSDFPRRRQICIGPGLDPTSSSEDRDMPTRKRMEDHHTEALNMKREVLNRPTPAESDVAAQRIPPPPEAREGVVIAIDLPRRRTFDQEIIMGTAGTNKSPDCEQIEKRRTLKPAKQTGVKHRVIKNFFEPKVEDAPRRATRFERHMGNDVRERRTLSADEQSSRRTISAMWGYHKGEPIPSDFPRRRQVRITTGLNHLSEEENSNLLADGRGKVDRIERLEKEEKEVLEFPALANDDGKLHGTSSPKAARSNAPVPIDLPRRLTFDKETFLGDASRSAGYADKTPDCGQTDNQPTIFGRRTRWGTNSHVESIGHDHVRQAARIERVETSPKTSTELGGHEEGASRIMGLPEDEPSSGTCSRQRQTQGAFQSWISSDIRDSSSGNVNQVNPAISPGESEFTTRSNRKRRVNSAAPIQVDIPRRRSTFGLRDRDSVGCTDDQACGSGDIYVRSVEGAKAFKYPGKIKGQPVVNDIPRRRSILPRQAMGRSAEMPTARRDIDSGIQRITKERSAQQLVEEGIDSSTYRAADTTADVRHSRWRLKGRAPVVVDLPRPLVSYQKLSDSFSHLDLYTEDDRTPTDDQTDTNAWSAVCTRHDVGKGHAFPDTLQGYPPIHISATGSKSGLRTPGLMSSVHDEYGDDRHEDHSAEERPEQGMDDDRTSLGVAYGVSKGRKRPVPSDLPRRRFFRSPGEVVERRPEVMVSVIDVSVDGDQGKTRSTAKKQDLANVITNASHLDDVSMSPKAKKSRQALTGTLWPEIAVGIMSLHDISSTLGCIRDNFRTAACAQKNISSESTATKEVEASSVLGNNEFHRLANHSRGNSVLEFPAINATAGTYVVTNADDSTVCERGDEREEERPLPEDLAPKARWRESRFPGRFHSAAPSALDHESPSLMNLLGNRKKTKD